MKLTKRMCLLLILCSIVLLQSCMSMMGLSGLSGALGMTTKPDDETSILVYGYLDINQEKKANTNISFVPWEQGKIFSDGRTENTQYNYFEEKSFENNFNNSLNTMYIDPETGIFAIEFSEPGDYSLFYIIINDLGMHSSSRTTDRLYLFDIPETPAEGFKLNAGEIFYWGAMELVVKEGFDPELVPSMNMTREQVLDLVALKLEGKGWDAWIERERAEM